MNYRRGKKDREFDSITPINLTFLNCASSHGHNFARRCCVRCRANFLPCKKRLVFYCQQSGRVCVPPLSGSFQPVGTCKNSSRSASHATAATASWSAHTREEIRRFRLRHRLSSPRLSSLPRSLALQPWGSILFFCAFKRHRLVTQVRYPLQRS